MILPCFLRFYGLLNFGAKRHGRETLAYARCYGRAGGGGGLSGPIQKRTAWLHPQPGGEHNKPAARWTRYPSSGRVAGCRRLIRSPGIGRFPDYATLKSIDHRRVEESSSRYRENRAGKASRQDPVSCEATDNPAWIRASAGMTTIDQAGGRTWRQDPASCSAREKSDRVRATLDAVFP
jgi:hypothetical protein